MTDNRDVVAFEEVGRGDIPLVGGKGANLGEMLKEGIPVPSGFIVTADAYGRFIEESGLRPQHARKQILREIRVRPGRQP